MPPADVGRNSEQLGLEGCGCVENAHWKTKRKRFTPLHPWEIAEMVGEKAR